MFQYPRLLVGGITLAVAVCLGVVLSRQPSTVPGPQFTDDAELQTLLGCEEGEVRERLGEPDNWQDTSPPTVWRYDHFSRRDWLLLEMHDGVVSHVYLSDKAHPCPREITTIRPSSQQ